MEPRLNISADFVAAENRQELHITAATSRSEARVTVSAERQTYVSISSNISSTNPTTVRPCHSVISHLRNTLIHDM